MTEKSELVETTESSNGSEGGFLQQSLQRSNKQIRQERGDAIAEDLEIVYKRKVEDLEVEVKRSLRRQENAFDFSPTNSQSLVMAKELESVDILAQDLALSLEVRNLQIQLHLARVRYNILFGFKYELDGSFNI
jgi:hypothetical protein